MARVLNSRKKRKRKGLAIFASGVLLAAAGTFLYGIPPSLQDISRAIQSAVSRASQQSAGNLPADSVLRGTIYDQGFNELAVSYRLYNLVASPADISDHKTTAHTLSQYIHKKEGELAGALKSTRQTVVIAENLDEEQAKAVESLHLPGVACVPIEARFYPEHTVASHILGFMGDNTCLAGVEGRYDAVLNSRTVRKNNIPVIDFKDQESLGSGGVDLILTLDLPLQKALEQQFRTYLASQGMEKGMGLLLEPGSGRILALVNQPSFNPNYFWKAKEGSRINRLYSHQLNKDLIRPILVRAAAIEREGIDGLPLLSETVAAPDYGFTPAMLYNFEQRIRLFDSVSSSWDSSAATGHTDGINQEMVTGVQVGATLASLVNGGWRITPFVADSVYDHATTTRYYRSDEATEKAHVLDPALSVQIRRNLFSKWVSPEDNKILYLAEHHQAGSGGDYVTERLFVGLTPAAHPRYLLLLAGEKNELEPEGKSQVKTEDTLKDLGSKLLAFVDKNPPQLAKNETPPGPNEMNMRQFFLGKELASQKTSEEIAAQTVLMPALRGLSLRKGLQLVEPYRMKVQINGSGKIIAQYPLPGTPLLGTNECILTLEQR